MEHDHSNVFRRRDTFFGICEATGQDFGFNPLWLRLALVAPLFFFPVETFAAYFGLGAIILIARLRYPAAAANVAALTAIEGDAAPGGHAEDLAIAA